jgi:hypothetical protein
VTGITDGEGCFQANVSLRFGTGRKGTFTRVDALTKFSLALRADDQVVVNGLKGFFGCGEVYDKEPSPALRHRGHVNPQKLFMVCKLDHLIEKVVPHFEAYPLQSKKQRDFEAWKSILFYIRENLSGTKGWARRFPDRIAHLQSMCVTLSQGRSFDTQEVH